MGEWFKQLQKEAEEYRQRAEMTQRIDNDPEYQEKNKELQDRIDELFRMVGILRGEQKALRYKTAVKLTMLDNGYTKEEIENIFSEESEVG